MYKSLILAGVVAIGSTAVTHHINEDIVSEIKTKTEAWTPYEASENPWRNKSLTELNGLLGTIITGTKGYQVEEEVDMFGVPESFDARNQWKSCIHPIRNQAQCGSCWAFGSSEAFSDRVCIASSGSVNSVFSAQDLVSCDSGNYACNGGYLDEAWTYIQNEGLVTDSCDPYTSGDGSVATCTKQCSDSESWKTTKCQSGSIVNPTTVSGIKAEIYKNGPAEGAFSVYQDFYNYNTGVYHHVSGSMLGGHAIKVLGWGNENGMDYWLCANSWGSSWAGLGGFFKIKQGDCGINDQIYACTPAV